MIPRERVRRSLEKLPTDRVPIFMWYHPYTRARLAEFLGVEEAAVETVLGNDVRQTWVNNNYAMEGIVHPSDGDTHIDPWGIRWQRQYGFNQIIDHHQN